MMEPSLFLPAEVRAGMRLGLNEKGHRASEMAWVDGGSWQMSSEERAEFSSGNGIKNFI